MKRVESLDSQGNSSNESLLHLLSKPFLLLNNTNRCQDQTECVHVLQMNNPKYLPIAQDPRPNENSNDLGKPQVKMDDDVHWNLRGPKRMKKRKDLNALIKLKTPSPNCGNPRDQSTIELLTKSSSDENLYFTANKTLIEK